MTTRLLRWMALPLACVSVDCQPPPPPPLAISVRARNEVGMTVENVEVLAGGAVVARSDAEGRARLVVTGAEGETFALQIKCPPGFRSPTEPLEVRRVGIAAAPVSPEYDVTCAGQRHALVVSVRAEGGAGLPVLHLGKTIARTDRSGSAHVLVEMDVHEHVELTLGTDGKESEHLHPQNPVGVFEMPDHDDIQVFAVNFSRDVKKPPPRKGRSGPKMF